MHAIRRLLGLADDAGEGTILHAIDCLHTQLGGQRDAIATLRGQLAAANERVERLEAENAALTNLVAKAAIHADDLTTKLAESERLRGLLVTECNAYHHLFGDARSLDEIRESLARCAAARAATDSANALKETTDAQ